MLGAGVSWALLPPADGAGVPRAPDPHSRETWAAGLRLRTGARLRRQQVCVGRWGREHEGCSPGVTETVLLSCWPGSGPGAGSSQPLAVCGPRLPWPRLGGSWLGGAVWGEGLRVPPALSAPRSPQAGGVCAFPATIPWGSRAAVWSPRVLWGSRAAVWSPRVPWGSPAAVWSPRVLWGSRAAVSSLGTALLWRLQSPCYSSISWPPGLLADNPRPQLGQWSCRICALRPRGSDGLGVLALVRGSVPTHGPRRVAPPGLQCELGGRPGPWSAHPAFLMRARVP